MNFWFGMSKEELYKNSEAINSDVVFFVSKTSPELHSGIHIYDDSDQPADNEKELVNFIAKGELVSCQLMDDYTDKEGECEYSGSYLLIKHYGKYNKNNPKKELLFYVLYTHLLPVKYYYFVKTEGMNATYSNEVNRDNIGEFEFVKHRIPFYLKYKITVKSGYDIPVLGNGMPKYSQHKVVAKDNEELYKYVLSLASGQECTNVPEGTCTILYNGKDNEVPLKNIEIVKTNAKVKIRKGAQVYNSKWKELGTVNKLLWSECCKVTEQDNEIKVQVSIKGEDLNITKGDDDEDMPSDEKVYVDISAIERVEFIGKITEIPEITEATEGKKTLQTEKGVLIYNENIPERIIREEDTIEISP